MPALLENQETASVLRSTPGALHRLTVPVEVQVQPPREDPETGDVTFWATVVDTDRTPNRNGLVFDWDRPEDVKLANFLKNPVMLYAHDSCRLPIGRWEKVEVTDRRVRMFGRIPGGPDYADLKPIRVRVRDGYLKANSIGFYLLRWEEEKDRRTGEVLALKVKEFEIVECSPCSIGAHPSAVIGQETGPSEAMKAFTDTRGARWEEQDLYDTTSGGVKGKMFRLSLRAGEPKPLKRPTAQEERAFSNDDMRRMTAAIEAADELGAALRALLARGGASRRGEDASLEPYGTAGAAPGTREKASPAATWPTPPFQREALVREVIRRTLDEPDFARRRADQARAMVRAMAERNRPGRSKSDG